MSEETPVVESKHELRAIIDDACITCKKRNTYKAMKIEEDKVPPVQLLMIHEVPLCVMATELTTNDEKFYLFYKCEDVWCLLNHLREGMMSTWLTNLKNARQKEYDAMRLKALSDHKKSKGRRSNRRSKAKEKAKKKTTG